MYMITDATEYELPRAVCDTLSETAKLCNSTIPNICKTIKLKRVTRIFDGIPSRIYKVEEFEENEAEVPDKEEPIAIFDFCKSNCTYPRCAFKGNGKVHSSYMKLEVEDCIKSQMKFI